LAKTFRRVRRVVPKLVRDRELYRDISRIERIAIELV